MSRIITITVTLSKFYHRSFFIRKIIYIFLNLHKINNYLILILFFHAIKISLVSQHNLETKWIVSAHLFIVHSMLIKLRTA